MRKTTTPRQPYGQSGHKTWDRYVNYIGAGNVFADGYTSIYIRPANETQCNGFSFPPGKLQKADLATFEECLNLPKDVKDHVLACARPVLLACAHHKQRGRRIIHGWILTETGKKNHRLIKSWTTGPTKKSEDVIRWITPQITKTREKTKSR